MEIFVRCVVTTIIYATLMTIFSETTPSVENILGFFLGTMLFWSLKAHFCK